MESLKIAEKKEKVQWDYDAEADVLYISIGKPQKAEGIDLGNGVIVRVNPVTNEIIGFTILNPVQKTLQELKTLETTAFPGTI